MRVREGTFGKLVNALDDATIRNPGATNAPAAHTNTWKISR